MNRKRKAVRRDRGYAKVGKGRADEEEEGDEEEGSIERSWIRDTGGRETRRIWWSAITSKGVIPR